MDLEAISPTYLATAIFISGAVFVSLWYLDHRTHKEIWKKDITDGELRTHRMILYASYGLMACLLLLAWFPLEVLPFLIACWITRTLHETLDELHWHLPRCTERETLIHLGMWITIHAGTLLTFYWGFFLHYRGFTELPVVLYVGLGLVFAAMMWTGHHEINNYKEGREKSAR